MAEDLLRSGGHRQRPISESLLATATTSLQQFPRLDLWLTAFPTRSATEPCTGTELGQTGVELAPSLDRIRGLEMQSSRSPKEKCSHHGDNPKEHLHHTKKTSFSRVKLDGLNGKCTFQQRFSMVRWVVCS